MKVIKVSNCQTCPFANHEFDACNLSRVLTNNNEYWYLPEHNVNENCPLKKESVTIGTTMNKRQRKKLDNKVSIELKIFKESVDNQINDLINKNYFTI